MAPSLFLVAHEAQQEQEQVDEVHVEVQRAHDRSLAQPLLVTMLSMGDILGLDLLGVSAYWQQILKGAIIVGAVVIDMRKHAKKA